jgi:hypothetical protein
MRGVAGRRRLAERRAEMIQAYWQERGYRVACAIIDDPNDGALVRSDLGGKGWPRRRLATAK